MNESDNGMGRLEKIFSRFKDPSEDWGVREFSVLIVAIAVQLWDVNIRLSGLYFPPFIPHLIALYAALAVIATIFLEKDPPLILGSFFEKAGVNLPFFNRLFSFLVFSFIAYCVPFINYLFAKIPEFGGIPVRMITGVVLLFWPIWIMYIAFSNPQFLSRWIGNGYVIIWVIVLVVSVAPLTAYQLQDAEIPGVMPGRTIGTLYRTVIEGSQRTYASWKYSKGWVKQEAQDWTIYAKTGISPKQARIDDANKRPIGVQVMKLAASSPKYHENDQVTVYAQIKAETLEAPVTTTVECTATSDPVKGTVFPTNEFTIETYDTYDIDCIFPKGELKAGIHVITLKTGFNFETMSYIETFFMEEGALREKQRKQENPLLGYPKPEATSSKGPVNINIRTPAAPLPAAVDKKMTISTILHNAGAGQIKQISEVYIFIPKGLTLATEIDSRGIYNEISCEDLPSEESKLCDSRTTTVYEVAPAELNNEMYKNIRSAREFRMYLEISDYDKILGEAPIKPGSFYATAKYDYEIEQTIQIQVEKELQSII
jgi:hypothetical protein